MSSLVNPVLEGRIQGNDLTNFPIINEDTHIGNANWGDARSQQRTDCLRIGFWNCGGLPQKNNDTKNKMIQEWIKFHHFDIVGLSECNVHWKKIPPDQRLPERTLGWFESLHLSLAYMLDWNAESSYQVGGVLLWSINTGSHRVMERGDDPTQMGRWCWTRYRGKHGVVLRVISAYRCVENMSGPQSAWSQQKLALEKMDSAVNPRIAFCSDLLTEMAEWTEQGDQIILGIDLNENVITSDFTTSLQTMGLYELHSTRHGPPPHSYIRGSTTIDGLYVSLGLKDCACGFLPFLGDHRPSWIDVPLSLIFGQNNHPSPKARRLKLTDPRIVTKYNKYNCQFITEHHLLQRIQTLSQRKDHNHPSFVEEYNSIDTIRQQGMQQAEKQCRKLRMGAVPFSPAYSSASRKVIVWKLIVKLKQGRSIDSRYLSRQIKHAAMDKVGIMSLSLAESIEQCRLSYRTLNALSKTAQTTRATWLESLATARANAQGIDAEQELRSLIHREHQRREARLIKYTINLGKTFGLSMFQINTENGTQEVTTKLDMESKLCMELSLRFHQAAHTPFASTPLLQLIGNTGTSRSAQQILEGTFQCPPEVDEWTQKLIPHLKYIPEATQVRTAFNLILSQADHSAGWKKMKEQTSPGYSSLSFAQFKAASLESDSCLLDSLMAHIPYSTGISPLRWQHGVDIMLQKQQGNFLVDKLRAILLFEADFNQNNKRFGREIMYHAEQHHAMAIEQFGSRKNMSAIDQSLNKALTFDIWRQFRTPGALCSNDAKSCYDRIVHNFASICLQRIGAPPEPIISMFSTIQRLNHHIRTVHGDSEISFAGSEENPIQGVGQGNGAGPQIWAAMSTPIFNMLRAEGCGTFLKSAISSETAQFVGYAFVDDTDLVSSHHSISSGKQVVDNIQFALSAWQGGIHASGGALVPEKSHWYFVDFQWQNGVPRYKQIAESPGILQVLDPAGQLKSLRQLQPWEAEKTLGVRLAPNGNMTSQTSVMRQQAADWSDRIRSGHLPRHLVLQAMLTTIMKTLEYPLPATTLSQKQCTSIMSPILQQCLPLIGVVRTFPRSLVYAPSQYHGLNIPNLYWLQGYYHIDRLLRFNRSSHLSGQLLRQSLEIMRLELGCNGSIFQIPFDIFGGLISTSWVKHTWEFLHCMDIQVDISVPELTLFREHDSLLMPLFVQNGFRKDDLCKLNRCRIFLQVTTVSDISDGTNISRSCWTGHRQHTRRSTYTWPHQAPLPASFWVIWQSALKKIANPALRLHQPLGKWITNPSSPYLYDTHTERIYIQEDHQIFFFRRMPGRPSRSSINRFTGKEACEYIPDSAIPATVDFHRSFLYLTGCADVLIPQNETNTNFFSFIQQTAPATAQWVFQSLHFVGDLANFLSKCHHDHIKVMAVSDGSFKDSHGTASWRISLCGSNEYFLGSAVVPGSTTSQSAYRSELAGIYGICMSL